MGFFKVNIYKFILTFLIPCFVLWYSTKLIIFPEFEQLQLNKNTKSIEVLISRMDTNIEHIRRMVNDYSKWDETYLFMQKQDDQYIYDNFREGTTTLEDMDVDFVFYVDLDKKVLFSKYANDWLKLTTSFEKELLESLTEFKSLHSIYLYKNNPLYIIKSRILKSDESGILNGHIIAGKFITTKYLSELTNLFSTKSIVINKENFNTLEKFSVGNLTKVSIDTTVEDTITNNLNFMNGEKYLFSIETTSGTDIIKQGKKTTIYFNLVISSFLFVVFYLLYKNQKAIERYNEELELKVDERTKELNKTIRIVEENNKKLYKLSNTDSLTQIRNRRSFFKTSKKLLSQAIEKNKEFVIVLIDLDHFKKINDTFGHSVGDEVLKEFCHIVNSSIDEETVFGRLGGEEFCITFYDKSIELAEKISNEIRQKCEETVLSFDDKKVQFTISMGLCGRNNMDNIDQILHIADELLYSAKKDGRNRLIRS